MGTTQVLRRRAGQRADELDAPQEGARTPLEKAIDRAFDYFPYRFNNVQLLHGWLVGPTFIVRADGYRVLPREEIYKEDPLLQIKVTSLLSEAKNAKIELDVQAEGHRRKPVDAFVRDGKGNRATVEKPGGRCTGRALCLGEAAWTELPFPLYALGKKLGVERYRAVDLHGRVVYGFKGKELVAVFSTRDLRGCLL